MIRFTTIITTMFAMVLGFSSPLAFAQQASAFQGVRTIQVKPGRAEEFEEIISKITAAQAEAGEPRRVVWQEVRGKLGAYHIVTPRDSYADFDEQAEPIMAPAAWANLLNRLFDTVESNELILMRNYPELNIPPAEDAEPPRFIRLTLREIAWGGNGEYINWIEDDLLPALTEAGVQGYGFSRIVEGDSPRIWIAARGFQSWAELDEPGVLADMNAEERQQLLSVGNDLTLSGENLILRRRPDLMAPIE